ncbi:gluconokinase [Corynebacterium sp. P5848]|uniref:gluconokinase n=1 Tax=Corynebacterium marambiense TaxID=2765364 RepID=UPI002260CF28|nr:gluconokinase [Corynebacterium marambiense]MCX7543422.1 gluconokinase [Corynebacterium marambiense]
MGVSGCGKSTVARAYADTCGLEMVDADDFHSVANIRKMTSGQPLSDEDRRPWLLAVQNWMTSRALAGTGTVIACSALRRSYRKILEDAEGVVWFVHLATDPGLTKRRLDARTGHFMTAALLDSQLEALEPLAAGELGITIDNSAPVQDVVAVICRATGRRRAPGT